MALDGFLKRGVRTIIDFLALGVSWDDFRAKKFVSKFFGWRSRILEGGSRCVEFMKKVKKTRFFAINP